MEYENPNINHIVNDAEWTFEIKNGCRFLTYDYIDEYVEELYQVLSGRQFIELNDTNKTFELLIG